jgi:putative cell wall-binding protein
VDGKFTINIPLQQPGNELSITAKDSAGNVGQSTKVTVKDITVPAKPTVYDVTDKDTSINGVAEAGSNVEVSINGSVARGAIAEPDGKFTIPLSGMTAGTKLYVTATDQAGNKSVSTAITVLDKTRPAIPSVNEVTDNDILLTGTTEPAATIIVKKSGNEIGRTTVGDNGIFSVQISVQPKGSLIEVFAVDHADNASSSAQVIVSSKLQSLIGSTRYSTAVEISKMGWTTSDTVLIVNGAAIVDGLTATPLAFAKNAPLLLTTKDAFPSETMEEIRRLKAKEIILIGGTSVISEAVETSLRAQGYTVSRIGGQDRYETSLLIAKELDKIIDVKTIYMAYGRGEPDALSIAAYAGQVKQPIILTDKSNIPADTLNWLRTEGLSDAFFIGGEQVISPTIITQMNIITTKDVLSNRISGSDRHETNAKVILRFYVAAEFPTIMVAKSETEKLVDALTAGPLAAKMGVPVLLVSQGGIVPSQKDVLSSKHSKYVHQIGGGINVSVVNEVVQYMD